MKVTNCQSKSEDTIYVPVNPGAVIEDGNISYPQTYTLLAKGCTDSHVKTKHKHCIMPLQEAPFFTEAFIWGHYYKKWPINRTGWLSNNNFKNCLTETVMEKDTGLLQKKGNWLKQRQDRREKPYVKLMMIPLRLDTF